MLECLQNEEGTEPQEKEKEKMNFCQWFDTLIEEKGIDPEAIFELETETEFHIMPYQMVFDAIKGTSTTEQEAIKRNLIKIDFVNGDIKHYFRHLAQALV